MHDKGFTMVPNAIIRSSELSVAEKAVWNYIASMPSGYRYSIHSACKTLHIGDKIWRRAIIKLEKLGLISVRHDLGKTTVYEASKDVLGCNVSSSQMTSGSNDSPSQLTIPPRVNEQQVTHYNNKKLINNNVDDDTRKKLEQEVMIDLNIELACKSCGISAEEYRQLAEKIIADWKFQDLPDNEWTKKHFMSVLRYKVNDFKLNSNGKLNTTPVTGASNPLSNAIIHTANIG